MSNPGTSFKELLLSQRAQVEDRIKHLTDVSEDRRKAWVESAHQLEAAKDDLIRIVQFLKQIDADAAKASKPTIKQAVLEALKHKPEGMTALEILSEINTRYFGGEILRTSLSPQLSRLKDNDRKIILRGNRWHLADEEPSPVTPIKRRV